MKETLIKFETAKLAKEKGFSIEGSSMYKPDGKVATKAMDYIRFNLYSRVSQSLLQKWLREEHNIDVVISPERYKDGVNYLVQAQKWDLKSDVKTNHNFTVKGSYWFNDNGEYPSYEKALEKGLLEALKLI